MARFHCVFKHWWMRGLKEEKKIVSDDEESAIEKFKKKLRWNEHDTWFDQGALLMLYNQKALAGRVLTCVWWCWCLLSLPLPHLLEWKAATRSSSRPHFPTRLRPHAHAHPAPQPDPPWPCDEPRPTGAPPARSFRSPYIGTPGRVQEAGLVGGNARSGGRQAAGRSLCPL